MLLGKYPLAAVWLYCGDVERSVAFYRDVLGLPLLDQHGGTAHFDGGGIRLSLHPTEDGDVPPRGSFFVFVIETDIDEVYDELKQRGVVFEGPLKNEEFGRATSFRDPDGHQLFIWQPPPREDPRYAMVAPLVRHYESVATRRGRGLSWRRV
ncbi:MAG: VOC family protein [Candidatus Geothermarchaeales archaeon]